MNEETDRAKRYRVDLSNVGLRAQATAAGLVQLCVELRNAGMLPEDSVKRIESAIANEIYLAVPRHVASQTYRAEVRARLDRIFRGEQEVGAASSIQPNTVELQGVEQN